MSDRSTVFNILQTLAIVLVGVLCLPPSQANSETSPSQTAENDFVQEETRLIKDLLHRANKLARPVRHPNDTVNIKFGLGILSLDEVLWRDESMKWDPAAYSGIWSVHVPIDSIWTPGLTVYNSKRPSVYTLEAPATIYSTGDVVWIPQRRIFSSCDIDLTYFPYDVQECSIQICSWTYDGSKVSLEFYGDQPHFDIREYRALIEWDIVDHSAMKNVKYYTCCKQPFPDLTFKLSIRRRPIIYTFVYIWPGVLLALATPFMFLMPPQDGSRIALGTGILVCVTLFFINLERSIRADHSAIPLINKYYMAQYTLVIISLANATIVTNLAARVKSFKQPPEILKKFVLTFLGRMVRVSNHSDDDLPLINQSGSPSKVNNYDGRPTADTWSSGSRDWLLIATVIDRLMLLIYLLLLILVPVSVFLRRP